MPYRFPKGRPGNPKGRPPRQTEIKYLEVTINKMSLADWQQIIERIVEKAKQGDMQAIQFLANYLIGKPAQRVDLHHLGAMVIEVKRYDYAEQPQIDSPSGDVARLASGAAEDSDE